MTAPRDFSRTSWRLKIERAKKHFRDLQRAIRSYAKSHPYEVRWEREPNRKTGYRWRGVFRITQQPDDEMALIVGDAIHNVRSALDHLAVAIGGKGAHFPISDHDLFARTKARHYVSKDKDRRKSFKRAIREMPDAAKAIIKSLQPYAYWPPNPDALRFRKVLPDGTQTVGQGPEAHFLHILSRYDNRDKHRQLVLIATGITDGLVSILQGDRMRTNVFSSKMIQNGTVVSSSRAEVIPAEREVEVQVVGTIKIFVRFGSPELNAPIQDVLNGFVTELPSVIFDALESFAKF